jgi:thiamine-phosphate pyrophosphorylase
MSVGLKALWRASRTLGRPRTGRKPPPTLLFFTDPVRTPHPERVLAVLPRGAGIVFRAFGAADAADVGRDLARLARHRGVRLLIGADVGLAIALRADGVHLPERAVGRRGDILRLRRRFLVTAAAHSLAAIRRARLSGVDAVVVSTVFASRSPSAGRPLGPLRFASLTRAAGLPVVALGGVNSATARRLMRSGAAGFAAIGALA